MSSKTNVKSSFTKTDGKTMTLEDKGQILWLFKHGYSIAKIAARTNRSKEWISILLEALGCDKKVQQDLIKIHEELYENQGREMDKTMDEVGNNRGNKRKIVRPIRRKSSKRIRSISSKKKIRRVVSRHDEIQRHDNSGKQTIKEAIKRSKDYESLV